MSNIGMLDVRLCYHECYRKVQNDLLKRSVMDGV